MFAPDTGSGPVPTRVSQKLRPLGATVKSVGHTSAGAASAALLLRASPEPNIRDSVRYFHVLIVPNFRNAWCGILDKQLE